MAVIIKDPETDDLIRALADRTGESFTAAVKTAVRERLQRLPLSAGDIAARRKRLAKLLAKADAMPVVDQRSADEIVGFNASGHFD